MDVLELLRADHRKLRNLFNLIRQADNFELKRELFDRIKEELDIHAHIEETTFYPEFAEAAELAELIEESFDDHQEITDLLEEIDETDIEDETMMDDDIEELIDTVEYHFDKEENELFPMVQRLLDTSHLERMGNELLQARQKLAA